MQDLLVSAQYPNKLYRVLMNSETVLTAWDGDKLVGPARAIDDGAILAQAHYKDYFYIEGMPEHAKNVPFCERHGFSRMAHGAAIRIVNPDFRGED